MESAKVLLIIQIACVCTIGYTRALKGVDRAIFGTKTAYDSIKDDSLSHVSDNDDSVISIEGMACKAEHVNMVLRHGYRLPGAADLVQISELLDKIKDRKSDVDLGLSVTEDQAGQLNPLGRREMREIGSRTNIRFKQLLRNNHDRVEYISTDMTRVLDSAKEFSRGLTGTELLKPVTVNDTLLRIYQSCPRYTAEVKDGFTKEPLDHGGLKEHVHKTLGLEDNVTLTDGDVRRMWEMCALDLIDGVETKWCSLMDNRHREILEYAQDLDNFNLYSDGNDIIGDINCVVVKKLFQLMDDAKTRVMNGSNDYLLGSFMFGHVGTLLGTLTAFGLFPYNTSVNEFWVNKASPMSGNVGFGLYYCEDLNEDIPGKFAIKPFFNEREIEMPQTGGKVYWYEDYKSFFESSLGCDIQQLCKYPSDTSGVAQCMDKTRATGMLMIAFLIALLF